MPVMKIPSSRRQHGFTLVELLVVIAIIAILASIGFGVGQVAIQKAKKLKALATCTAVESAVNNFFTEYGSLPNSASSDTTVSTKNSEGITLVTVLLGLETTNPPLNTRSVKFLNAKEGKSNKDGLIYSTDGKNISGLYDPWGGGYKVILDCDYGEMVTPAPSTGSGGSALHGRRVAVWSNGADGVNGSGKANDDVKTWQ